MIGRGVDERRLDDAARAIAGGMSSRRAALAVLAGAILAGLRPAGRASAVASCKTAQRRCVLDADCCSNDCRQGRCRGGGKCLANGDLPAGATCEAGATCCSRTCQTTFVDDGCGTGDRCCELANQRPNSIRGRCTTDRDCCSCNCVDRRCRTNSG